MIARRQSGKRSRRLPLVLIATLAVLAGALAPHRTALAHPLDVYLSATYLTVEPAQIEVELDLTIGVLVAPQALAQIDTNGDQAVSDDEGDTYVSSVLNNIELQVDGAALPLTLTNVVMPDYLTLQAGYGVIRIFAAATPGDTSPGTHAMYYMNANAPSGAAYQVNTFVNTGDDITIGTQNRDSIQQSLTVDYTLGSTTANAAQQSAKAVGGTTTTARTARLTAYLNESSGSNWQILAALGLAIMLGGLHALTPGHGKTLAAAYLVGSKGTVKHAVALGGIVTLTHTASVIAIGLLALFASQFVVPNVLVPGMEIASGLLVVVLGFRLIRQRWLVYGHERAHRLAHERGAEHHHHQDDRADYHADGAGLMHDHGDGHVHSHLPANGAFRPANIVALGISGGLIPCPEALGIMIVAVGLNRVVFGLGLIVSFSIGLAAMLIGIGILLVKSRALIERAGGISGAWSRVLPLGSAVIVTVLGLGITLGGISRYLG